MSAREGTIDPRSRYRTLRLCSSGGGFEAVPRSEQRIDLAGLRSALKTAGIPVVDARVMLIASLEAETTISSGGRILIKTPDAAVADRAFSAVLALLPPDARSSDRTGARARSG